jgi:hypothetical protein
MKQRSALAVGLHTTENYKMPQKTKLQNKDWTPVYGGVNMS